MAKYIKQVALVIAMMSISIECMEHNKKISERNALKPCIKMREKDENFIQDIDLHGTISKEDLALQECEDEEDVQSCDCCRLMKKCAAASLSAGACYNLSGQFSNYDAFSTFFTTCAAAYAGVEIADVLWRAVESKEKKE